MTHLILHKVRGEPAFDVGEKIGEDSDGDMWIIPTSGHRAYPYQTWDLDDLRDVSDINQFGNNIAPVQYVNAVPTDWPDHYACESGEAPKPDFNIMSIISNLSPKFLRRM